MNTNTKKTERWSGKGSELSEQLEKSDMPEDLRRKILDMRISRNCGATVKTERTWWAESCDLGGGETGRKVTLTSTYYDEKGNQCDEKSVTWCSPGQPQN